MLLLHPFSGSTFCLTRRLVCLALTASLALAGLFGMAQESGAASAGSVNPYYGSFSTEIPIATPEFHGLEPNLKLIYSSGGTNSWIGVGWSLTGLSFIERGLPGGGSPHYDAGDSFFMDGMELLPCTSQGGTHCTKIQNYARIVRDSINNRWFVTGTNGNLATYDPLFNTSKGTFRWLLSSVSDLHNNTVTFHYWSDALNNTYLDRITYNGTTVTFYREWRSDPIFFATGADQMGRTNYRLKAIDVKVNGTRARAYQLNHQISGSTSEANLISVQQFGRDATVTPQGWVSGTSFLPPMTMQYQLPFKDLVDPIYNSPSLPKLFDGTYKSWHTNASFNHTADFNGDGRTDLMWRPDNGDGRWVVAYGTASGFILPNYSQPALPKTVDGKNTWADNAGYTQWGDFNGDGKTDYMWVPNNGDGRWLIAYGSASGFVLPSYNSPAMAAKFDGSHDSSNTLPRFNRTGDFNGDGKTDFMWKPENGDNRFLIAYGSATGFVLPNYTMPALANTIDGKKNRNSNDGKMRHGDYNGDGKTDYFWIPDDGDGRWLLAYGATSGFVVPSYSNPAIPAKFDLVYQSSHPTGHFMRDGDFNGDGRTDYMWVPANGDGRFLIAYSNGYGFEMPIYSFPALDNQVEGKKNRHSNASFMRFGDFNGDGKMDYLWRPEDGDGRWLGAFALSYNFVVPSYQGPIMDNLFDGTYKSFNPTVHYMQGGDFNGDGKSDLMWRPDNGDGRWVCAPATPLVPNYLKEIKNGIGGTTSISYTPSSAWSNTFLPVGFILQTVTSLTTDDGLGNASTTDYNYEGALWTAAEKRFLGFRKVTAVLDPQGNFTETYYLQQEGSISKPETTYFRNNQNQIFSYTQYFYDYNATLPYTSLLTNRWDYECNLGSNCRRSLIQLSYDQYGNVIQTIEYGDVDVQGDERLTVRGYSPNLNNYLVGLPAFENVYEGIFVGGPLVQQLLYFYDDNASFSSPPLKGNLTEIQKWDDQTGGYLVTSMEYDFWGNQIRTFDERGFESNITFDPIYHIYPIQSQNALNHISTRTWDTVLGLETETTDANGATLQTTYDSLGRRLSLTYADGNTTQIQYWYLGVPSLQRVREIKPDGSVDGLWEDSYQDGLGRVYKTVREGGFTKEIKYSGTSSRVWQESLIYGPGETPRWITYSYDGANRIRTVTHPDGSVSEVVYANDSFGKPFEAHYDELDNERLLWRDTAGNLVQVREKIGFNYYYTTYAYDVMNRVVEINDALGNTTLFTWDSLGRKLTSDDPDLGYWTYSYDEAGNQLTQTDAKSQTLTFNYDALNRMVSKVDSAGMATNWFYDEPGFGESIGRLTRITYPQGSESHYWDVRGLEVETSRCVINDCQTLMRSYDTLGRLASITYPDGEVVNYSYDSIGRLDSVSGYVNDMTWSSAGQLLSMTYANGTVNDFTYNQDRLWLETADVTNSAGTLYNASYSYDAAARVSAIGSTTNTKLNLSFGYDSVNRLLNVSGGQTQSFTYDAVGNMTYNSAVGNYTYGSAAHAHAVTAAGNVNYTYDANGNMKKAGNVNYTWDGENRLASITKPKTLQDADYKPLPKAVVSSPVVVIGNPVLLTETTSFDYDASGIRIRKSEPGGAVTKYFGALLQKDVGAMTQFYYAGPVLVAKKTSTAKKYWYHADHLNSIRMVTDDLGLKVKGFDYAAFGKVVAETGRLEEDRGFNGHITDAECGLVYMRARYYNPALGRFISADTVVPDPANPQALNRYSFVYNNPISNTDPTGHAPVAAAILSAVITTAATTNAFIIATAWIGAGLSVAGYFTKDPTLSAIGGILLGFAGGYVAPGPAQGIVGGILGATVAAATSPLSPLDPGLKESIGWVFSAFGSVNSFRAGVEFAINQAANVAAQMGVSWVAEHLGLDPGELNIALTVVSFAGNYFAGTRYKGQRNGQEFIDGVWSRESGGLGFGFDVVDIVLGYQGLPTASAYEYMFSGNKQLPLVGYSLGSLDANNLAGFHIPQGSVTAVSLPAFNGGAAGVAVFNGSKDFVNGFSFFGWAGFGKLFTPYATTQTTGFSSHFSYDYPILHQLGLP